MLAFITVDIGYRTKLTSGQPSVGRNRPRIWWCPTGGFAHLPLHAAGTNSKRCSDYVVSSYTPTLGTLVGARSSFIAVEKSRIKAIVAAVPRSDVEGWAELLSAPDEANAVRASIPEGTVLTLGNSEMMTSDGISAETLLENLPDASILHLACHGHQNTLNALHSGFVMRDRILTIESLIPVPLPHAFMAFLSACETAKGDKVRLHSVMYA
jgi:CHAT domain-containing protein